MKISILYIMIMMKTVTNMITMVMRIMMLTINVMVWMIQITIILMIATMLNRQWFIAISMGLLAGSLVGFLLFNFPPARIFMGDGGSLVIGWLLAVATIRTTFVDTADPGYALGSAWYGVFMPIVVLAIPLYDFTSVCVIRILQGRSPFQGDQQHFSHRLAGRGFSGRQAVITIWALAIVTGSGGILLGSVRPVLAILIGVLTLLVLLVLAIIESSFRRRARA